MFVYSRHGGFHVGHGEIVNPSADDFVELLQAVIHVNAPAPATELFQFALKLRHGFLVRSCSPLAFLVNPEPKTKIFQLCRFRNAGLFCIHF